jgi:cytochrome c-type biogenesis protein CcmH/NrfG
MLGAKRRNNAADPEWNRELTVAWQGIGYVYARQQKFEDAIGAYQKAATRTRRMQPSKPAVTLFLS